MVGSKKDTRTDVEIVDDLHSRFGLFWFGCREVRVRRERLDHLASIGLLERSRQPGTHTVHYRVKP